MGFQHLSPEERSRISRIGGKAAGPKSPSRFTAETAPRAARKGGRASPSKFTSETGAAAGRKKKGKKKPS